MTKSTVPEDDLTTDADPLLSVLQRIAHHRTAWKYRIERGLPAPGPTWDAEPPDDPLREALIRLMQERTGAQPVDRPLPRTCEACHGSFGGHVSVVHLNPHDLTGIGVEQAPLEYFFCERCARQTRALIEWQRREAR